MTNQRFADLFEGPPRQPESEITQREMDLARSIQDVTEEIVLRMARHTHRIPVAQQPARRRCGPELCCNGRRAAALSDIWIEPAAAMPWRWAVLCRLASGLQWPPAG